MTDRPIIFSAPMVEALLAGRKTQTRRLAWREKECRGGAINDGGGQMDYVEPSVVCIPSPWCKVQPGDRLWVREAWGFETLGAPPYCCEGDLPNVVRPGGGWTRPYCRAGTEGTAWGMYGPPKWRPSIHMPRSASRLTLTVTDVRVQRLREITPADAIAEGISPTANSQTIDCDTSNPCDDFRALWDHIHGPGAWEANPEVVALTFTVERRNIDATAPMEAAHGAA